MKPIATFLAPIFFVLIFASIGKGLKVIDDATFSAVVIMVIVTTLITPPVLKMTSARSEKKK